MKDKGTSSGIGFVGALQVAFIVLKLCKVIDWKWRWVLSPTWISAAVAAAIITALCVFIVFRAILKKKK